ncbi:MAG: hypothetical protein KatS3mg119_2429 [Rhodothalassiaceae bacterium]|nr:MAG: hypothetical protein KatS3mg119_2429 [Rhodothalassiaceae bacterium]
MPGEWPPPDPGLDALIPVDEATEVPWEGGRLLQRWWFDIFNRTARLPRRSEFSPASMGRHLKGIGLMDITPEGRFVVRLAGADIARAHGHPEHGRDFSTMPGSEPMIERFRWAIRTRRPYMCLDLPLRWARKEYLVYSVLVMPLSQTGARVDMLIAHTHVPDPAEPA